MPSLFDDDYVTDDQAEQDKPDGERQYLVAAPIVVDEQTPEPAPITPPVQQRGGTLEAITASLADAANTAVDIGETTLSIASSVAGFTLGGVNALTGLAKNIYDLGPASINALVEGASGGSLYDGAEDILIGKYKDIPADMMSDFNTAAGYIQYEPESDSANRWVQNIGTVLQDAREFVGDKAYSMPLGVDEFNRTFEIDNLDQMQAIDGLYPVSELEMGIRAGLGALGQSSIDLALMAIGAKVSSFRGMGRTVGSAETTIGTTPAVKTPVTGLSEGPMDIAALDALPNSKPRFRNFSEAKARLEDIAGGKVQSEVVVETVKGMPTKVLSGQDSLLAAKELNRHTEGTVPSEAAQALLGEVDATPKPVIKQIKVKFIERESTAKADSTASQRVAKRFAEDDAALEKLEKINTRSMLTGLGEAVTDIAGGVKTQLLERGGDIGKRAVMMHELSAGATPEAYAIHVDAWSRVWKGLSDRKGTGATVGGQVVETERSLFDKFVRAERDIAIAKTKLGKAEKDRVKLGNDSAQWLQELNNTIGSERYAELAIRADEMFKVTAKQLDKYLAEGLVSQAEYNKMVGIRYLPTEMLDRLDPTTVQKIGGKTITVGDSGIQVLGKAQGSGILLDSESLITEFLIRTENRISRNRANQQLYKLALKDPKNSIVKLAKMDKDGFVEPREGFGVVKAMVGGQPKAMYMPKWMADQWLTSDPQISAYLANVARIVSGTAWVKPLATGYNPSFVLTNLPRDIVHMWIATNKQYNTMPLMYLGELTHDIGTVLKDSLTKTGRYRDYIREGGGMNFLTHQGKESLLPSKVNLEMHHKPWVEHIKGSLSYFNEQSEIVMRLALRERVMRNQVAQGKPIDPVEATWQARRYLDFAQGGSVVKAFDNVVPYLNASTQGFRTTLRAAKENPKEFATKVGWVAAPFAAWEAHNWLTQPEVYKQIPEDIRRRFAVIMTDNFIIDANGNKRYVYYKIQKDQSVLPFTSIVESLVQHYITGLPPTNSTFGYIADSLPGLSSGIPTYDAYKAYVGDRNWWYEQDIYGHDKNVEDYAKFKGGANGTEPLFKDFAEFMNNRFNLGIKPQALQESVRSMIPTNDYLKFGYMGYDAIFKDVDETFLAQTTEEWIAKLPVAYRVYSLTHPDAVGMDNLDRAEVQYGTESFLNQKQLDEILYKSKTTKNYQEAEDYARSFADEDPFSYKQMMQHIEGSRRLDKIFGSRAGEFGDMSRNQWLRMLSLPSNVRAEVYYEKWHGEAPERKKFMDGVAGQLSSGSLSFMDSEFMWTLQRIKKERNGENMSLGED